jgi:hypothetical protein
METMFGLFKKSYPVLTPEMFSPADKPISTADAKRLFKQYMKDIGFLDREELSDHANYLGDEIKQDGEYLKGDWLEKKSEVSRITTRLKDITKKVSSCADPKKKELIEGEITDLNEDLDFATKELQIATEAYTAFKNDKRSYLIDYINRQVHGPDWNRNEHS